MMERIPRKMVPPLMVLLRASARKSQFLSTVSCFRSDPRLLSCSPIRFYASPPTNDPRAPHSAGYQYPSQGYDDPQSQQLPRYFPPPEQQDPPPPRPKRSLRPYIYAAIFFLIGGLPGLYVRLVITPPAPPIPGSDADKALTAAIHQRAAKLPIVQSLTDDPAWHSWDAYATFTPEEKRHRITSGPLRGARGLGGYQRIFHNRDTGDLIAVVWVGGALAGWPGVVHGGVIATIMDECMGRCATAKFPVHTGVTANLDIKYLQPVKTNRFFVVRAKPLPESTDRKGYVDGLLEDIDGKVLVHATGLFVLPKNLPKSPLKWIELKNLDEGF